jgi:TetR/AcrR family tetracycline transcriptional repressor
VESLPAFALGVELLHREDATRDYPNLSGATKLLTRIEPERLFVMGLKVLLDGMPCRLDEIKTKTDH